MVTGLHLALKEFLPDGWAAKSHSKEAEAAESFSFGCVLRAQEKQLQDAPRTVSASSIAAEVAAVQNGHQAKSAREPIVGQAISETNLVDTEKNRFLQAVTAEAPRNQPQQVLAANAPLSTASKAATHHGRADRPTTEVVLPSSKKDLEKIKDQSGKIDPWIVPLQRPTEGEAVVYTAQTPRQASRAEGGLSNGQETGLIARLDAPKTGSSDLPAKSPKSHRTSSEFLSGRFHSPQKEVAAEPGVISKTIERFFANLKRQIPAARNVGKNFNR